MKLESFGWSSFFATSFSSFQSAGFTPARVALQHRNYYVLYSELGELRGEVTGKMEYFASGPADLPVVGDWVVVDARPQEQSATILEILPRRTKFSRTSPGSRPQEQVLAANVDVAFIVSGLDAELNLRRLERYLVLAAESGAHPVLIVNKADLREDRKEIEKAIGEIAAEIPQLFVSALRGEGLDLLIQFLKPGTTGVLLGSSGVGKTTIINRLLGSDKRKTQSVREDDSRGRHTTSYRELILLPSRGLLIDTPGLRELQLLGDSGGVDAAFHDIADLATQCRFRDCTHEVEPGCAVREALEAGTLDPARFNSYRKLLKEIAYQHRKHDVVAQRKEKERIKKIMAAYRKGPKKGRP